MPDNALKIADAFYRAKFSFYGFGIVVQCQDEQTLQNIQRDYSYFLDEKAAAEVLFEVNNTTPDYSKLPPLKAHLYTPRNICYRQQDLTFIDYFGKGLTIIDRQKDIYRIFCSNPQLRHEIVFLSILSLVGQRFDSTGLHRVHGLGLEIKGEAVLILSPSGGGKTTFLLDVIKNDFIKLISEDSPLIDPSGRAFPFPIRIGIAHQDKPEDIPQEHLHFIERMEFQPKYVIDIEAFRSRISLTQLPVRFILCGRRCLGKESSIRPLSKLNALKELVKNSVVGLGLYQGIEFLFQRGAWELFKKSAIVFSRFKNALRITLKSKSYRFIIGSDRSQNVQTFLDFCRENIN